MVASATTWFGATPVFGIAGVMAGGWPGKALKLPNEPNSIQAGVENRWEQSQKRSQFWGVGRRFYVAV
jgi:hypothetical protein